MVQGVAPDDESAPGRPDLSHQAVTKDLKRLRGHAGATYSRIEDCASLKALPVVLFEVERQKRPNDHGPVALDVIDCIARDRTGLLGDRDSFIVSMTLNLAAEESPTLEDRRQTACSKLRFQWKTYLEREEDAYQHLAGVLLRLQSSPCSRYNDDFFLKVERMIKAAFDEQARHFAALALASLRTSRDEGEALEAARELLKSFPRGLKYVDFVRPGADFVGKVAELLRGAERVYYREWVSVRRYLDKPVSPALSIDDLRAFLEQLDRRDEVSEWRLMRRVFQRRDWREYEDETGSNRSKQAFDNSYAVLLDIFMALEASDDWKSLEPGDGTGLPIVAPMRPSPTLR